MNRLRVKKFNVRDYIVWGLLLLSAFFLFWATTSGDPGDTALAAKRVERALEKKMAALDTFINDALKGDWSEWMSLEDLPDDMVIYRYVDDTLQSWDHTFTVSNDEIASKVVFQRLSNPRNAAVSPFAEASSIPSFINIGQSWYLIKSETLNECHVYGGLEVLNSMDTRRANTVNRDLRLNDSYSIKPLSESGGSTVSVNGQPQFKIIQDSLKTASTIDSTKVWVALILFIAALLLYLSNGRSLKKFRIVASLLVIVTSAMFIWGADTKNDAYIFSPTLYADGPFLYSLGAVLIINLAILALVSSIYLVRNNIYREVSSSKRPYLRLGLLSLTVILALVSILLYTHKAFSSIVINSNINLEIYKLGELSLHSALVYVSFITMLVTVPLLAQLLRPIAKSLFGLHFDAFAGVGRTVFALAIGAYFVTTSAILGFRKEQNRVDVWANRLSVDRDISLELQLRRVESSIANDFFIASLSALPNSGGIILNRIVDNYMYSISQDYDVSVLLLDENERDPALLAFFNDRVRSGVKIHDNSRFLYTTTVSGHPRYSGLFTFFNPNYGVSYMLVGVEPKSSREYGGYSSLLDISAPGRVALPSRYSFAKYSGGALVSYKGNFAYPTLVSDDILDAGATGVGSHVSDGYVHFVTDVDGGELVVISRKHSGPMNYVVAAVFLALFAFFLFSVVALSRRRQRIFETAYFKNRITSVLMGSLIVTLIAMAAVSVLFVYQRNDANKQEMMSDKINAIQTMMAPAFRYVDDYRQLNSQEITNLMDNAGNMSKADITLYSPGGKAFKSTALDVFDRMLVSDRIDADAYDNIVYGHKRYFINREKIGSRHYWSLYAPVFNDNGKMVAIICSPYTDENYDFEMEAVMHSVTIITLFLILLLLARFMSTTIVDKMLRPIVQIGRKMNKIDIDNLEYIEYDRDDEISTLVKAYNLMVNDLAESTRQLAQAERDKAWSAMARQVAHEIKNPLTPMKLQLQRLIRLKQRNAPGWEDKFDEVAKVVLDHIDILSDTANEFSIIAKLATEESTEIHLDTLLQEEISMFDNRDNIVFTYYGLQGVTVMGPKPQLTRVFVNLLTNAVQAIEIRQQEAADAGREPEEGRINVSLRNSTRDGYYDVVVEDNGSGVPPENQSRLFTPNFTTKSSGTGLGLAICRSILEKCGAEISYSKSFSLEGACFTVTYPKNQ